MIPHTACMIKEPCGFKFAQKINPTVRTKTSNTTNQPPKRDPKKKSNNNNQRRKTEAELSYIKETLGFHWLSKSRRNSLGFNAAKKAPKNRVKRGTRSRCISLF